MSKVNVCFHRGLSEEKGFVYYNALLDLVLVALLMPLIVLFYLYTAEYTKDLDGGKLEWRLFTSELQSYLSDVEDSQIINGATGLRIVQHGNEYDIEVYGSVIRKQKFNQGHEIMMTGVIKCNFVIEGDRLKVIALLTNGSEEHAEYLIAGS